MSSAFASPIFTGVPIAVASAFIASGTVSTGFVVSTIVIFCSAVEAFPFSSVAVQITVVVPTGKSAGALFVVVTLKISLVVGEPKSTSVLTAVASIVISLGATIVGFVVSTIMTSCIAVDSFPFASFAVHLTGVVPNVNPPTGALCEVVTS